MRLVPSEAARSNMRPSSTLLSRLRHADADFCDPRHSLACRYIAQTDVAMSLVRPLLPPPKCRVDHNDIFMGDWRGTVYSRFVEIGASTAHTLLRRRAGRTDTPIGFVDLSLPYFYEIRRVGEHRKSHWAGGSGEWEAEPLAEWQTRRATVAVEVKVSPVPVGAIIRQANLFREHMDPCDWVVATAFTLSAPDRAELERAQLRHVLLGRRFDKWAEAQEHLPADPLCPEI